MLSGLSRKCVFGFVACLGFRQRAHMSPLLILRKQTVNFSSENYGVEKSVSESKDYLEDEGLVPKQVFNFDETGPFGKKMSKRTLIEQKRHCQDLMKDSLTLLLCGDAT
ncbi:hypothetical protein AVEN_271820-1, partial [Araneus ventricosus]